MTNSVKYIYFVKKEVLNFCYSFQHQWIRINIYVTEGCFVSLFLVFMLSGYIAGDSTLNEKIGKALRPNLVPPNPLCVIENKDRQEILL